MKTGGGWFRLACLAVALAATPQINARKQKGDQVAETPPRVALPHFWGECERGELPK